MLLAGAALLQSNRHPTRTEIREALAGNLCRCTGYSKIVEAVELSAARASD
jgi:carbon-monoxide dehydrogenase small subunit